MSASDIHRQNINSPPLTLDEGYWEALLSEGEHASSVHPETYSQPEDHHAHCADHDISIECNIEDWHLVQKITDDDDVIDLAVIGYNRGGLLVEWNSLRGFVPASQLIDFPVTANNAVRRNHLIDRVGKSLSLRVIELNQDKNRLILSERAAMAKPGEREEILTTLEPGSIVEGFITNLCDFGAFVDLGGLEGLIHISELSWGRVGHPSHMLERGKNVTAYVLGVDPDAGRIALSLKRLHPDPWKTVEDRYQPGQIVVGVITNVVDFGAFACIEDGLEGLIHVSELAEGHFLHPRNVVSEGDEIRARILTINGQARRLGLSLRLTT